MQDYEDEARGQVPQMTVPPAPKMPVPPPPWLQRPLQAEVQFNEPGYEALGDVLHAAYVQAARGKGRERHADDKAFDDQPIFGIAERRGLGFLLGQVDKKSEEAQGMAHRNERARAQTELLGAIVYLAAAYIHLDKGGRL